jgi:two-component system NarL family sensor kinase
MTTMTTTGPDTVAATWITTTMTTPPATMVETTTELHGVTATTLPPGAPGPSPGAPSRQREAVTVHDDRPLVEPISVGKVVARFAVAGFVALVFVIAFTAIASRRVGTEQAIEEARRVADISGVGLVAPVLDDDVVAMDRDALDRLDAVVRDDVLRGSLVRVKIWREDGTIVYADEPRLIGEQFTLGDDALEVLATGGQVAEVSDLSDPENRYETERKLLEVYSRIETPSGTPLLFETYFNYGGVTEVGRNLWLQFAPITIGALILLELVQIPIAWSMARRLQASQQERERLLRHALEASDAERRRIASDLHDGVVQELTGVSLTLAAQGRTSIEPQQALEASEAIRSSIKSLRSLLVEIYPPNLAEEGLETALGDLLSGLRVRGIETHLDVPHGDAGIPNEIAALVYRVAQEALRNVVTHAGAEHVRVGLTTDDGEVRLVVDDDGRGFTADSLDDRFAEGHVGLRSLAGLVAQLDGTLTVSSRPGTGTRVETTVPLDGKMRR